MYKNNDEQALLDFDKLTVLLQEYPIKLMEALSKSEDPKMLLASYKIKFKEDTSNYEPLVSYFRGFMTLNSSTLNAKTYQEALDFHKRQVDFIFNKQNLEILISLHEHNLKFFHFFEIYHHNN